VLHNSDTTTMVQTTGYGAALFTDIPVTTALPPRTRRRRVLAASLVVAAVCLCVAVVSFGFSSSAVESDALLSKYAVKKAAPRPLGKVELAVLKIKTRAHDKVTELSSKLKDAEQLLSRKEETLDSETRRLQLAQKRLDDVKAQQKEWKAKRDALKDAKKKFEKEENDASNRADDLKNKISDSRDSLKDTKADIDKREHRLSKLRRAVEDASTEYAVADSKKMHLNARLQQDDDEVQALKDKAAQIKQVLATGAISGAQKLAQMAGKVKTQLQQVEAQESKQQGGERAMVERLRHLEDERLQLMRKATNFQSKAVRYKMLAAKADDSAADAARLLHKDVMRLQQEAGIVHHSSFGTREESTAIDHVTRYHLMSSPRRLKLKHDFRLRSSLVGTSSYSAPAARGQPQIYQQKRARSDGNIFQAIDAPNDGIAYTPSLAAGAGAGAAQAAPRRSPQLSSPLRSVSGDLNHVLSQDAGNPLSGDYGASD